MTVNIASQLTLMAEKQPDTYAVIEQGKGSSGTAAYAHAYTYKQLDEASDLIANGLEVYGIGKGTRTVLMVQPGLDFFATVFALFKRGAILIAVDPGMGIKNLSRCLAEAEPEAFIGNARAHIARILFAWSRATIKKTVLVGRTALFGSMITPLDKLKRSGKNTSQAGGQGQPEDSAAILFTSGSTGVPKGVVYTHSNFTAQIAALKGLYNIEPGEIDLATFPLFALFGPALGMTSVIPSMDFTKPGRVDPHVIIAAVRQYQCTTMFGSPALLNRVARYSADKPIKLPSLKRILSAGAPVAPAVLQDYKKLLNDEAQIFTPYGATEALPISSIGSHDVLNETARFTAEGKGICIGTPVPNLDVRIIEIREEAIPVWHNRLEIPADEIGEICVQGPQVTGSYYNRAHSNRLAKIASDDGFYHRTGDLAYRDEKGRLWFCGRKTQRVVTEGKTLFTICCEGIFNTHPAVFRTALVGVSINKQTRAVICVELEQEYPSSDKEKLTEELLARAELFDITKNIKHILFHKHFPVDIRHNAKIGREKLMLWAAQQVRKP